MQRSFIQKFTPAQVGNTIRVRVPDIDRARMDSQNTSISVVVIYVDYGFCEPRIKHGVINHICTLVISFQYTKIRKLYHLTILYQIKRFIYVRYRQRFPKVLAMFYKVS